MIAVKIDDESKRVTTLVDRRKEEERGKKEKFFVGCRSFVQYTRKICIDTVIYTGYCCEYVNNDLPSIVHHLVQE